MIVKMVNVIREQISWLPKIFIKKHRIWIFCYHGVVERIRDSRLERNLCLLSSFKSQLQSLRRMRVLHAEELMDELQAPLERRKPAAVLTFDDGYANNLLAGEILAEAKLPWSVFVSTGALGRGSTIWTVELSLLLLHGQGEKVDVLGRVWPLTSRRDREDTFQDIRYPMKTMPADLRQETMARIRAQFPRGETQRLLQDFPSLQMLTWEEVIKLAQAGVEIGSHGVNHEIHHGAQPEEVRRRELVGSKAEIERRLERPCRFFAFPNGDFNVASAAEVREAGYDLAFTLEPGNDLRGESPYLLPRISGSDTQVSSLKFAVKVLGKIRQSVSVALNLKI